MTASQPAQRPLRGDIVRQHKDQIVGLARNEEAAEKGEHPLDRIISIEETNEGLVISTTDIHLPRRIGEALKRAFHGELAMRTAFARNLIVELVYVRSHQAV